MCSATAAFEYNFEPDQDEATLLVYLKFGPRLEGLMFSDVPDYTCLNINSATLEVFEEGEEDPVFECEDDAEAWLKVVEK